MVVSARAATHPQAARMNTGVHQGLMAARRGADRLGAADGWGGLDALPMSRRAKTSCYLKLQEKMRKIDKLFLRAPNKEDKKKLTSLKLQEPVIKKEIDKVLLLYTKR